MNHQHRLVWSKRLRMLVAAAETARGAGKSGAGESVVRSGAGCAGSRARRHPLAAVGLAAAMLASGVPAWAAGGGLSLPSGSLLDINNGSNGNNGSSYSSGWATYTVDFTPESTGNNYILFAFRQDPAYWTFGQVSLVAEGDATNLFTNAKFATGGALSGQSGLQAPADWGIVYQTGTTPHAAGRWQTGFNGNQAAGSWYDGAVGSFDGIYQGVQLTAGVRYTIGFTLKGDNPANSANGIEMGVFGGSCVSLTGPVSSCIPNITAFTALATPDETSNAGQPATDIDTRAAFYRASEVPSRVNPRFDGGVLQMDASSAANFGITGNGGTIDQAGNSSTLSGVLSDAGGSGSLKIANSGTGGSVTLTGANTYTARTTVDQGATLALAGNGSIASSSSVVANGTLDISGLTGSASLRSLAGNGSVDLGSKDLRLTAAHDTFSGTVSGTGSVVVAGGTQTLSGTNTYQGGTKVTSGGTLRVSADANLGAASGSIELDRGRLQATDSFTTTRDITLGAGHGYFDVTGGATLSNLTGSMSGPGALVKDGAGTLVLGGRLSHAGGTVVYDGVLELAGTNTYTGGNALNGGTLRVSADANLGAASNGLAFDGGTLQTTASFSSDRAVALGAQGGTFRTDHDTTLVLNGSLSGSGAITKDSTGTLILGGDNAGPSHQPGTGWTGGLKINGGLVQVTNAWGLGWGEVTLNGGSINTLVNIRTGQTIQVAAGSSIDTAADTTTTLTGSLATAGGGAGCFVKTGQGTLNLAGAAVLANGTCVQQGTLRANGILTSNVTVDRGATLAGSGTILGNVDVRGTLSPGNSPGYLTTAGTVRMAADSTYREDIAGTRPANAATPVGVAGYHSVLQITGAGQFVIDAGSTLAPRLQGVFSAGEPGYGSPDYVPALGETFHMVTAEGGIRGRFDTLVQPAGLASGTRFAAFYDVFGNNSIDLVVLPSSYTDWLASANKSTRAVAAALDTILERDQAGAATTAQDQLLYTVARQNDAALPGLAKALAGEVHAALAAAAPQAGLGLQDVVGRQLTEPHAASGLWIDIKTDHARWQADQAGSGLRTNSSQVTVGADLLRRGDTRAGLGLTHASTRVGADIGSGNVRENVVFAYGQHGLGGVVLDGLAAYGHNTTTSERGDPTLLSATPFVSSAKGRSALLSAGVTAPMAWGDATVAPFVRATLQNLVRDATSEGTASPAALSLRRYEATGARLLAGVRSTSVATDPLKARMTWNASAALGIDGGALVRPAVQASLAGVATTIRAPEVGRVFLQLTATGTARVSDNAYLYYGVSSEARQGKVGASLNAGLRAVF